MSTASLIPLFPLPIVVFPGQAVPLHIFEERYRAMIADCEPETEGDEFSPFGVSLSTGDDNQEVGCTVVVTAKGRGYPDGSFDIMTRGEDRYKTIETFENRPYLTATVEFFEDEEVQVDPDLSSGADERYAQLLELAQEEKGASSEEKQPDGADEDVDAGETTAFQIAARVGMELNRKQKLLEMTNENERLQFLVDYFDELIPSLRQKLEQRRRVKSNGQPQKRET